MKFFPVESSFTVDVNVYCKCEMCHFVEVCNFMHDVTECFMNSDGWALGMNTDS